MLAIRMQRTGRKGHASFRVIVQDSRFAPNSGRVVAQLGHYDPHTKNIVLNKELATQYLQDGAQPSPRVVVLLKNQKVALPSWVVVPSNEKKASTKKAEKLRKNQPKEEVAQVEEVLPEAEVVTVEATAEADTEVPEEPAEEPTV